MSVFRRHMFVCTNRRPEGHPRGSCAEKGSEALRDALKEGLKKRGVGKQMRVNAAGCLDFCEQGCTVVIYPEGIWYGGVKPSDVDEILDETMLNGRVIDRLVPAYARPKVSADPGSPSAQDPSKPPATES